MTGPVSRRSWIQVPPKSPVDFVHADTQSTEYTVLFSYVSKCKKQINLLLNMLKTFEQSLVTIIDTVSCKKLYFACVWVFSFRSLSFVLALSGTSFLLLTVCYVIIDMKQWWSGVPFYFAGKRHISRYVLRADS